MATFTKEKLSASTDGKPILVTGTNTAGANTIHTGSATPDIYHEVWLWAMNTSQLADKLTIEWGGTTSGFLIEQTIPGESGLVMIAPGLLVKGNATPVVIEAFAVTASVINITGFINVIS